MRMSGVGFLRSRVTRLAIVASLAALSAGCGSLLQGVHAAGPEAKRLVLVELFTSEGCSSCPPADALLESLDRDQNIPGARVVVLSEHVDYWNYEGWRDPFSSREVTARQEAYVASLSQDSAYTPEAVVDGARGLTGSDRRGLVSAIEQAAQQPKAALAIANPASSGGVVTADLTAAALPAADLYAVLADDHDESSVSRGENSGRHLTHVAVTRVIEKLGALNDGFSGPIRIGLPINDTARMRLVVFAQERKTGHILGVAEASL